jgi:hypothetical protein
MAMADIKSNGFLMELLEIIGFGVVDEYKLFRPLPVNTKSNESMNQTVAAHKQTIMRFILASFFGIPKGRNHGS